ncbi:hypothetical protein CDB59_09615 [Campylobacter coli]|nr:hypothetical protein [Campylobacter coli]EAI6284447.1 hypothetical protein [Campylobacter coli]EAI7985421.1 hypothetical protein [Campylobacter coli]EAJ0474150.1 hypothetical protein [Campylobacter coli]EBF6019343.1 hypothetical protein [Campylobacter coli]
MTGREGKNDIFVDAVGLELLYIKPNGFYIKLDLAKAAYKYEADGKRRDRLYTSMGFYFLRLLNQFYSQETLSHCDKVSIKVFIQVF